MGKDPKRVVVVTTVHNRREITLQCLGSLRGIDRTGLEIHIVIVDDGSTDGTREAIRRDFPEVEIIEGDGNLWYTAGMNRGIEAGLKREPDYILAINDDEVFDTQFLHHMIRCAEEHPRTVVGALLLQWDSPDRVFQVGARWDTWYGGWRHRYDLTVNTVPREPWEVEIIVGNCVLYPLESIVQVGLMNENYFPHYGDVEYTPRMRKAGWRLLIEPNARVYCQPTTIPPSLRTVSLSKLWKILFSDRNNPNNLRTQFLSLWESAPSPALGAAAFFIALVRRSLRLIGLGTHWPDRPVSMEDRIFRRLE